jgi:hypothetical protein
MPTSEIQLEFDFVLALMNSVIYDWFFRLTSTNAHVSHYQIVKLPAPIIVDGPKVNGWRELAKKECWGELADRLGNTLVIPGEMPRDVTAAVSVLSQRIQKIEDERVMKSRSDRSVLSDESAPIQDAIDSVLCQCFGLSADERRYITGRLAEML